MWRKILKNFVEEEKKFLIQNCEGVKKNRNFNPVVRGRGF